MKRTKGVQFEHAKEYLNKYNDTFKMWVTLNSACKYYEKRLNYSNNDDFKTDKRYINTDLYQLRSLCNEITYYVSLDNVDEQLFYYISECSSNELKDIPYLLNLMNKLKNISERYIFA